MNQAQGNTTITERAAEGNDEMPSLVEPTPFGSTMIFSPQSESSGVLEYLADAQRNGRIQAVDLHFASFIYSELQGERMSLAQINTWCCFAAYLSNQVLAQNTCIAVHSFEPYQAFGAALPDGLTLVDRRDWLALLAQSNLCQVCDSPNRLTEQLTPFVLFQDSLYLNRYFQYEAAIANFIALPTPTELWFSQITAQQVSQVTSGYFSASQGNEVDWQKIAVENAITRRFAVITGGPGTGKTTTVVKLLACLQELKINKDQQPLTIQLVAPTGKAAQRLSESIAASVNGMAMPEPVKSNIPTEASTIHRLLRPRGLTEFLYNKDNPLGLDLLILDEASMVDISMMYKLFSALPSHAQVMLLGDRQQLASVEAGNVLAELGQCQQNRFMVELQKSYRFNDASAIGQLAAAIKAGQGQSAIARLHQPSPELTWYRAELHQLNPLIEIVVDHYVGLQQFAKSLDLANSEDVARLFHQLLQFQLLACVRQGDFGVEGLNQQIQQRIGKRTHQYISGHSTMHSGQL